jgi:thiamine pyrophosphate-dependent acetolactate synthase large subunit-like protein
VTELVCHALGRRLAALSRAPLFGLAGSGNLEFISAFQAAGGGYHAACHEAGVVAMADGWAQASGDVGVATLHQGPGLTNALTALVDSGKARTPLLVIVPEVAAAGGHRSQWIDQSATLEALGAGLVVHRLAAEDDVGAVLIDLLDQALLERRALVLLAPVEVQVAPARPPGQTRERRRPPRPPGDPAARAALAERLSAAHRPVILAGRGAQLSGAGPHLVALAEHLGALLATTAPADGLFAGEPFSLGTAGGFASEPATRLLGEADVVLAVGASLNAWTTCDAQLFPQASVERIDLDADADGVSVVGDAAAVAGAVLDQLPERGGGWRTPDIARELAEHRRELPQPAEDGGVIHPGVLCAELERRLPRQRCVVLDSGHFMAWPAMLTSVAEPGAFLFGQAFQAVGLGLARAIGAALARPDRPTVAIIGDGGAMMSLTELDTAVRVGARLLVVVFNDAAYGAEVHDFAPLGVDVAAAIFPDRDLAAIARGLGAEAVTVRDAGDLDVVDRWSAEPSGPLLLDAKVDPEADAASLMTPLGAAGWSLAPQPTEGTQ